MTEMTISVEEFDIYDIVDLPTTISFHLREFNVCALPLPLCIKLTTHLPVHHRLRRIHGPPPRPPLHRPSGTALHRRRGRLLRFAVRDLDEYGAGEHGEPEVGGESAVGVDGEPEVWYGWKSACGVCGEPTTHESAAHDADHNRQRPQSRTRERLACLRPTTPARVPRLITAFTALTTRSVRLASLSPPLPAPTLAPALPSHAETPP